LGANINTQDNNGLSIFHDIIKAAFKNDTQLLLRDVWVTCGGDPYLKDIHGKLPHDTVLEDNNVNMDNEGLILLLKGDLINANKKGIDLNLFESKISDKLKLVKKPYLPIFKNNDDILITFGHFPS